MNQEQKKYVDMQISQYNQSCSTIEQSKKICVGLWEDHENYPYEDYIFKNFKGPYQNALDFGCGMGRMIKRMLQFFHRVDGADLIENNLKFTREYLNKIENQRCSLFQTDGTSCKINTEIKYDLIYSTICIHHICVYDIRYQIISDIYSLLKEGGQCVLQFTFGNDNGIYWFNNHYNAKYTNGGEDITIPNLTYLPDIINDLETIGFKDIKYHICPSPHSLKLGLAPNFIFFYLNKS